MYAAKLWDEDKWNIHSSSYNSSKYSIFDDKKDSKQYHEQKYGAKEKNASSDYMKREERMEKEKDNAGSDMLNEMEEEKNEKKELDEHEIQFKAARQVFSEGMRQDKKIESSGERKEAKTIEDAIKKAIEGEKQAIIIDNS